MSGFEQILWYIAIPTSVVFALQAVMTLFGVTLDQSQVDFQHHDGVIGHGYFPVFTVRNLIIFLMMFGWTGIAMIHQFQTGIPVTLLVSFVAGLALMLLVALMFYGISKLASSGDAVIDKSVVGLEAKVYLKVPANRSGFGKVTFVVQGQQKELVATTMGPEILTGSIVKIVELKEDGSVIVAQ